MKNLFKSKTVNNTSIEKTSLLSIIKSDIIKLLWSMLYIAGIGFVIIFITALTPTLIAYLCTIVGNIINFDFTTNNIINVGYWLTCSAMTGLIIVVMILFALYKGFKAWTNTIIYKHVKNVK